jgi:hypothetical protein
MGINGGLLTSEDWNKAGPFFAHSTIPARDKSVAVIGDDYSVREIWVKGSHAEVLASYRDLGRIDSNLRYIPPDRRFPKRAVRYHLILTGKQWESAAAGQAGPAFVGRSEWRIENPPNSRLAGLHAAIQYITAMRDKTGDASMKKNGESALAFLNKMKE